MKHQERKYNLLAYGNERIGISQPPQDISNRNFVLSFEPFNANKQFHEFDGVILFQGIFEKYRYEDGWNGIYLNHSYDRNELDKRKKELSLLIKKGGFVCFILHKPFVDSYYHSGYTQHLSGTDLCKYCLNLPSFYRKDFKTRVTNIRSLRDEFTRFLELYGAASSYFDNYNNELGLRKIAEINRSLVGMVLFDREFFVPSLVPENTNDRIVEYFSILCEALTSTFNKLQIGIPSWLSQFSFEKEDALIQKKQSLNEKIEAIDDELGEYTKYKKVLLGSGEILVENVSNLLKSGFDFKLDSDDEFKEDLKIINYDNEPLVFIEVKGTNSY